MGDALISVIIPTFNRAKVIGQAIESVLQQTYRPLEVIVVDDGSADETAEVVRSYGDPVVYIHQNNAGPSAARNRGIRQSKGDFVAFLDSDDVWLPTKLERQASLLQRAGDETPCCLCNTIMRMPDQPERTSFEIAGLSVTEPQGLWINPAVVLATRFVLFNQAVLVRRDALVRCGGYDEQLWFMEDHDLALRLALQGPWAMIQEPLAIWCGASDECNLSVAAYKQPVKLYESIEYIDRKILEGQEIHDEQVTRCLRRDLQAACRRLVAERMAVRGRAMSGLVAKGILAWHRFRQAWFRHSRSYPRVKVEPIPQ